MTINKTIDISIALGLLVCFIAVAFRLFSEADINAAIKTSTISSPHVT